MHTLLPHRTTLFPLAAALLASLPAAAAQPIDDLVKAEVQPGSPHPIS